MGDLDLVLEIDLEEDLFFFPLANEHVLVVHDHLAGEGRGTAVVPFRTGAPGEHPIAHRR